MLQRAFVPRCGATRSPSSLYRFGRCPPSSRRFSSSSTGSSSGGGRWASSSTSSSTTTSRASLLLLTGASAFAAYEFHEPVSHWWSSHAHVLGHGPSVECAGAHYELLVSGKRNSDLKRLDDALHSLPAMDKRTMSGNCAPQTDRMVSFMGDTFGLRNVSGKFFVRGVPYFELSKPISGLPESHVVAIEDEHTGARFEMSIKEIKKWQNTFSVYYSSKIYPGERGKQLIQKSLEGQSAMGDEAWRMKWCIRISKNPIFCRFDGRIMPRKAESRDFHDNIYLVSVCGVDFAGRDHDIDDIKRYVRNWKKVYKLDSKGEILHGVGFGNYGRDFQRTGVKADLDEAALYADLKSMARLRLTAQDELGIQVVGETGIGLGVFAGGEIGIADRVRSLSAMALREVLEEQGSKYKNIKAVCVALPIFGKVDNYHYFEREFKKHYSGDLPVYIIDNDMHNISICAAQQGYTTSQLNPADSHGVVGEYWQNYGPGTEEKLALTSGALLTQHHMVNPRVTDTSCYVPVL